jgi:hypothetical protein
MERVSSLVCTGCGQAVVAVEEQWVGDHPYREKQTGGVAHFRGIHWWPSLSIAGLDDAIPQQVRDAYIEGAKCIGIQAPRAAAVMFRRTLEAVVRDKGSAQAIAALDDPKHGSLAAALRVMANEATLHPTLAEWAKEIRLGGNAGGHFDPIDDVTIEEAESLSRFVRELFDYLYEMPAKLRRARQSRT